MCRFFIAQKNSRMMIIIMKRSSGKPRVAKKAHDNRHKLATKIHHAAKKRNTKSRRAFVDHDTQLALEVRKTISKWEAEADQFLRNGRNSVKTIEDDLEVRLFVLLRLATIERDAIPKFYQKVAHYRGEAVDVLCSICKTLSGYLEILAKSKNVPAAECLWDTAFTLVTTIKGLASTNPDILKRKARKTIFSPSFRTKENKFTDDFAETAKAIELGADFPLKKEPDAKYDLDSGVTRFVLTRLIEAYEKRDRLLKADDYMTKHPSTSELTRDQRLLRLPGIQPEHLTYLKLPPYNEKTARLWWKSVIKPQLDSPKIHDQIKGSWLEEMLKRKAKKYTDASIRDLLKKLCEPKVLKSFASEFPQCPRH
jgi:hypothetical protein